MSQATDAESKMVETFEKLAEKFGTDPQAYFEVLKEEYSEDEETLDNIVNDVMPETSNAGEDEPETSEDTQEGHPKANGEKCEITEDIEDCHVHSKEDESTSETSESDDWNQPAFEDPNAKEWYDNPDAIMSESEIRGHEGFEDLEISVVKLQHKQGKHGVCEACGIAYAGKGSTCAKCENDSQKGSDSESDGLTVADIQQTFGVNAETARTAKENYEKGLFGSVKEAIEA